MRIQSIGTLVVRDTNLKDLRTTNLILSNSTIVILNHRLVQSTIATKYSGDVWGGCSFGRGGELEAGIYLYLLTITLQNFKILTENHYQAYNESSIDFLGSKVQYQVPIGSNTIPLDEEVSGLQNNNTCTLTTFPHGRICIGVRRVYNIKPGINNKPKYKARFIAKLFHSSNRHILLVRFLLSEVICV